MKAKLKDYVVAERGEIERAPPAGRNAGPEQHGKQPEAYGPLVLAEGPGMVAGDVDQRRESAGQLGDQARDHDQHHEHGIDARHEREGQIERGVGDDIAKLVQHEPAPLD
jgi:hypothetical protein